MYNTLGNARTILYCSEWAILCVYAIARFYNIKYIMRLRAVGTTAARPE